MQVIAINQDEFVCSSDERARVELKLSDYEIVRIWDDKGELQIKQGPTASTPKWINACMWAIEESESIKTGVFEFNEFKQKLNIK